MLTSRLMQLLQVKLNIGMLSASAFLDSMCAQLISDDLMFESIFEDVMQSGEEKRNEVQIDDEQIITRCCFARIFACALPIVHDCCMCGALNRQSLHLRMLAKVTQASDRLHCATTSCNLA